MPTLDIYHGDNLAVLKSFEPQSFDLIYIDPPFNTGKTQTHTVLKTVRSATGDRQGFKGERYQTLRLGQSSYADVFDDFLDFLGPRLEEAKRLLKPAGSFFLHLDYREVHYCKVFLDALFGRASFINEIIWAYDYGGRSKQRWSTKHDTLLWYARDPKHYTFNYEAIDRVPYMAPNLVGPEKAKRGKTPTDVWWHTIVPTNGKERVGYATQKPLGILRRIIAVHSNPGDRVLDFFAGSGTTGVAAIELERDAVLVERNPEAINLMKKRFEHASPQMHCYD